jgi:hypothetical protein
MAVVYTKVDQGITTSTGTGLPIHTAIAGDRYTDTATGNTYQYTTSWQLVAYGVPQIPQSSIIYVDSINGIDSPTLRGDMNLPYATPEYALSNITNTGTVTATTTSTSATLTSVSSTTNIKIGQYITGTGIPYNSIVVSKTSNTIVLSKTCTASATITATWWTAYKVILIGDFTITSSICKPAFFIDAQTYKSNLTFGAITLFSFDVDYLIPHYISLWNVNGTSSSSVFIKGTIMYADVTDLHLTFNNVYTIGTSWAIGDAGNLLAVVNFYVKGNRFEAAFGYVNKLGNTLLYWDVKYSYGLLGGHVGAATDGTYIGDIVCPTTVSALTGGSRVNYYGNITGNVTSPTMFNLYGNLNCSVLTASNGGSQTLYRLNIYGNVIATTFNNGSESEIHGTFQGALVNSGTYDYMTQCSFLNAIIGGSITINNGSVYANGYSPIAGTITVNSGSFYNNGTTVCGIITIGSSGNFENYGSVVTTYVTYTGAGKFVNNGKLRGLGGINIYPAVKIINNGTLINNGSIEIISGTSDGISPTITKTLGTFFNNGFIFNAWGLMVNYTANTIPEKNIVLGFARSNGKGGFSTSTSGTGRVQRVDVSAANTNTSITVNDGISNLTFSVTGAGKSISVITDELIVLINSSALLLQNASRNTTYGGLYIVENPNTPLTFSALTNMTSSGVSVAASFAANILGGGTELTSEYFTN